MKIKVLIPVSYTHLVPHHHGLFDLDENGLLIACNVYVDYALWVLQEM